MTGITHPPRYCETLDTEPTAGGLGLQGLEKSNSYPLVDNPLLWLADDHYVSTAESRPHCELAYPAAPTPAPDLGACQTLTPGPWGRRQPRSPRPTRPRPFTEAAASVREKSFEVLGFHAQVRAARLALRWSEVALKTALHVELGYIRDIEAGRQGIRPWHIAALNRMLNLRIPQVWAGPHARAQAALPLSLAQLREEKGLTRVQLAARLGVAVGLVTRWETGCRPVSSLHLTSLGHELGVVLTPQSVVVAYGRLTGYHEEVQLGRVGRGWTLREFGAILAAGLTYVGEVERGSLGIRPEHITVFNDLFGLELPVGMPQPRRVLAPCRK